MRSNANLYIVKHEVEGEPYISACVGDVELGLHMTMAGHFGARLIDVVDAELELRRFLFDCYFEGALKEWDRELA